jgi:quercetin dioxygenase-like cupin family protein
MSYTDAEAAAPLQVVAPLEGDAIWFNGALQNIKVPGDWSEGAFSLVEVESTRGRATGLHTDPSHETFYLLDGEVLFHVDGEEHRAQAGQTVAIRRGVPHAFLITSETARFLVLNTPGGHDRFFRAGGEPAASRDFASAPPPDHARTARAAEAHGVTLLGPPPFAADSVLKTSG